MKIAKIEFTVFTKDEEIKINSIDKQHFKMSQIINKIYKASQANKISVVLIQLSAFLDLLKTHFAFEEKLMKETKFNGYISHKLEHDRFFKKIESLTEFYSKDNSILTIELLDSFNNWFHNHIRISDKKFGEYFVAMGIK